MQSTNEESHTNSNKKRAALVLGALGIVYGDIGTSPLYAFRECFFGSHAVESSLGNILGVLSLITWALIIEISVKYILVVMKADNRGEGGVLALMALVAHPQKPMKSNDIRNYLILVGLFGAALLYGDGMITPAISVLSAVEGLKVATPFFEPYIIPLTIVILCCLFYLQSRGTAKLGSIFGPIILVWFVTLGTLGAASIFQSPEILFALDPRYALRFLLTSGWHGFAVLGAVFLVITGAEALYADMGHFGKNPIRIGWFSVVMPGLLLNYYGQAALVLRDPSAAENPFYNLAPTWGLYPLVLLATAATVIASQALISGAFSLTRQAVQLGCLPRLDINHTSHSEIGQIYVPLINKMLCVMAIIFVLVFKSSSAMAAAYGIAVSLTMIITTLLTYFVSRQIWGWPKPISMLVIGSFLLIDFVFVSANAIKLMDGGWIPLVIGAFIFTLMTTWRRGRQILGQRLREQAAPLDRFWKEVKSSVPHRVPGTAIFMTGNSTGTPPALVHNLKHNKVLHETIVLLTVTIEEVPIYSESQRVQLEVLDEKLYRLIIHYGFMETPDVPGILSAKDVYGIIFDTSNITYFLGRETVLATEHGGMAVWREKVFALMTRNAARATSFYCIPPDQVIEIGLQIEI